MTPTEQAYWSLCLAVAQQGYILWLERVNATLGLMAFTPSVAPKTVRPKLTVVR